MKEEEILRIWHKANVGGTPTCITFARRILAEAQRGAEPVAKRTIDANGKWIYETLRETEGIATLLYAGPISEKKNIEREERIKKYKALAYAKHAAPQRTAQQEPVGTQATGSTCGIENPTVPAAAATPRTDELRELYRKHDKPIPIMYEDCLVAAERENAELRKAIGEWQLDGWTTKLRLENAELRAALEAERGQHPTLEECFAAGKGPQTYDEFKEGGKPDTPEERARFEAYMRGHCWSIGTYDESIRSYDTTLVRMLYGVWRDRGSLAAPQRTAQEKT